MFRQPQLAALCLALCAGASQAALVTPTFTTFGTLAGATFGGSGIPNNKVAIETVTDGNNTITLGLTAHNRFNNPTLTDNNAGSFGAGAGLNYGTPATPNTPGTPSNSIGATWSLGWYIDVSGGGSVSDYVFELLYDLDPTAATQDTAHGTLTEAALFSALLSTNNGTTHSEASQNLNFAFFTANIPGFVIPPGGSFDGNAAGEYTLSLRVRNNAGALLGESAILVNVNGVPEPASLALVSLALLGMRSLRRKA